MQSNQEAADKEARRIVKLAYQQGRTVGFSLARLIDIKTSLKVIRAVYRNPP